MNFSKFNNEDLDEAFGKVNLQYFAATNPVVKELVYNNLSMLAEEIKKRDSTLVGQMKEYIKKLKGV